jgi:hypothetical protein
VVHSQPSDPSIRFLPRGVLPVVRSISRIFATWCTSSRPIHPSDFCHVVYFQPSDPSLGFFPRGVLLAVRSIRRIFATWCTLNPPIHPSDDCHVVHFQPSDPSVGFAPRGALSTLRSICRICATWRTLNPPIYPWPSYRFRWLLLHRAGHEFCTRSYGGSRNHPNWVPLTCDQSSSEDPNCSGQ